MARSCDYKVVPFYWLPSAHSDRREATRFLSFMLLIQSSWFSVEELGTEAREQAGEPGGLGGQAEPGRLGFVTPSDHFSS